MVKAACICSFLLYIAYRLHKSAASVIPCENFMTHHGALQNVELFTDGSLEFELTCLPDRRHVIFEPQSFANFGHCPTDMTDSTTERLEKWIERHCDVSADTLDGRFTDELVNQSEAGRPYLIPPDFEPVSSFPLKTTGNVLDKNVLDVGPHEEPLILKDTIHLRGMKVWIFEPFHSLIERVYLNTGFVPNESIEDCFARSVILCTQSLRDTRTIVVRACDNLNIFISVETGIYTSKPPSDDCAICLEPLNSSGNVAGQLVCGHWFHGRCIDAWLARKPVCPYCNQPCPIVETRKPGWITGFQV